MDFNESEREFFLDSENMRRRFGPFGMFAPALYKQLVDSTPEKRKTIFDRFNSVNFRFNDLEGVSGVSKRELNYNDSKYYYTVQVSHNLDPTPQDTPSQEKTPSLMAQNLTQTPNATAYQTTPPPPAQNTAQTPQNARKRGEPIRDNVHEFARSCKAYFDSLLNKKEKDKKETASPQNLVVENIPSIVEIDPVPPEITENLNYFFALDNDRNLSTVKALNTSEVLKKIDETDNLEKINEVNNAINKYTVRESFIHEMLHCMIDLKECVRENNENSITVFFKQGGKVELSQELVRDAFDRGTWNKKQPVYNMVNRYREEGVVEDWANDIAENLGFCDELKSFYLVPTLSYGALPYIAGMYNAVSNGELRNQHMTGNVGEKTPAGEVEQFDKLFNDFMLTLLGEPQNAKVDLEKLDYIESAKSLVNIIKFCDEKFENLLKTKSLNKSERLDYLGKRKSLVSPNMLKKTALGLLRDEDKNEKGYAKVSWLTSAYERELNRYTNERAREGKILFVHDKKTIAENELAPPPAQASTSTAQSSTAQAYLLRKN